MIEFGVAEPGATYRERPCAFGVVVRDGRIACVRVERGERSYYDLPGGAIDRGETESHALTREFIDRAMEITKRAMEASPFKLADIHEVILVGGQTRMPAMQKAVEDYFKLGYRGARFAFGYGACPNLEDRAKMMGLLEPERIGVTLSEELQLHPEQSTDAFVLHHPEAKYFNV